MSLLVSLEDLTPFLYATLNLMKLTFHMESVRDQLLVHCCFTCTCSHFGPSFNNTTFHITHMSYDTQSYTYLFQPMIIVQWMTLSNVLLILKFAWPKIPYSYIRKNSDSFNRSKVMRYQIYSVFTPLLVKPYQKLES